ncbi:MAG: pyruvate dehydrogenase E1 component alpha subunit PdhA [Phormidesmis priestleyi Ana]|uniref:Pyruvate dehydrogenase E1 component subunit alpha n=1 Tax=Phormidesmis priestleyi Ana TaxID=1666911 RepID=A0A0P8C1G9_9CYAN|nr:MAG: pyruvate dehydrogenase E1 component alpha subunit PdhA [Phormidesmis priestleyi Ana]
MVQERPLPTFQASESQVTRDEGHLIYEDMVLGRYFEDKCAELYQRGKVKGFVHLYNGQEAVCSGVVKAMRADDYVCSTYRDHVHALSAGVSARAVMAELFGKETGCSKGRGGSMHMFSKEHNMLGGFAFIGEGIPVALGAAFQTRYRHDAMGDTSADQVTAAFFGDGTTNNGQFFECLNMAALWKLPILFVVENNKWAIGMAHERASSQAEIYKKASVFGMPGYEVDGMNVLAVREAAKTAVERARAGEGPTLLECLTYRYRGHSVADPDELRPVDEKKFWRDRDPIKRFEAYLLEQDLSTAADLKAIRDKITDVVEDALTFAEESPDPNPADLYKYIFAED